jgi:hypothetical protein
LINWTFLAKKTPEAAEWGNQDDDNVQAEARLMPRHPNLAFKT